MCGATETHLAVSKTSTENLSSNKGKHAEELTAIGCSDLLELAAKNDLKLFQKCLQEGRCSLEMVGTWYFRQNGSRKMAVEERTPLMIAALYGNLDVLKYILSCYAESGKNVNYSCGNDKSTALHCAAAGGSPFAVQTVNLLLKSGANLNSLDAQGRRPLDVISVPSKNLEMKKTLEAILNGSKSPHLSFDFAELFDTGFLPSSLEDIGLSSEGEEGISLNSSSAFSTASGDSFPSSFSTSSMSSSPKSPPATMVKVFNEKTGDFTVDPTVLDIKNSIYTTDEFRMYSFKIRPCSRAYSHDWTECPFAHPGENAKRRDPRKYHYSCVPCPDFRKGSCQQGDACEFAHGVFECWLHPAQYRTRLCKDGTDCNRKVCFFAHTVEELRPLYVSTGSAVPSPRSSAFLDSPGVSSPLGLTSPMMMSSFSPIQQGAPGTPPMSPSSPSALSMSGPWSQPKVPVLHLPSRLRSSVKAHDVLGHDMFTSPEIERRMLNEYQTLSGQQLLSTQARVNAAVAASKSTIPSSQRRKFESMDLPMSPLNLDELFAMENLASPKISSRVPQSPSNLQNALAEMRLTQSQKAVLESQYHTSQIQSPRSPSGFVLGSISSTRATEIGISEALVSAKAAQLKKEKLNIYKSADKASDSLYSNWGSPTGKVQWGVHDDELFKMKKGSSIGYKDSQEPDLSWVQNVVSEGPSDIDLISCSAAAVDNIKEECPDMSHLEAWIDRLQFDQIVA